MLSPAKAENRSRSREKMSRGRKVSALSATDFGHFFFRSSYETKLAEVQAGDPFHPLIKSAKKAAAAARQVFPSLFFSFAVQSWPEGALQLSSDVIATFCSGEDGR